MVKDIKIDIQEKPGFPVKIGDIELWFDSSLENIINFFNAEKIINDRMEKSDDKIKNLDLPKKITVDNLNEVDAASMKNALDISKEFVAAQYDLFFGEGTFDKLYKRYPDFNELDNALKLVSIAISERIEELEIERKKKVEEKTNQYLNKKAKKK